MGFGVSGTASVGSSVRARAPLGVPGVGVSGESVHSGEELYGTLRLVRDFALNVSVSKNLLKLISLRTFLH